MDKAFDSVLQNEVDAAVIAKTSYYYWGERFRYQCLYCGEEVYLAAVESSERSPHFRHRRGNNDKQCDRYLGQPGAVEHYVLMRKHKQEHIEFCFNRDRITFEICALFSEEELRAYEERGSRMTVSSKYYAEPFLSIPLSKEVFVPGRKSYFTITEFSTQYIVSFDSGFNSCTYQDVMRDTKKINIFRVRMQDEHCRHQTSSLLYTNTEYIGISECEETMQELKSLDCIISEELFSFATENRDFYGMKFSVKQAEFSVRYFFQKHDYQLETSESFSILWPPVYVRNSCSICAGDTVYVHSSFELIPHGNINVDDTFTREIDRDVMKLHLDDEVIIYEKNIDICIHKKRELQMEEVLEEPVIIYSDRYTISEQYDYFLFDQNGCTRLIPGSNVYLSESDRIVGYKNGHIKVYVYAYQKEKMDTEQLIYDMVKYHPQSETFNPDDFMNITTDEIVLAYLENCYRSGRINTVVKRYIKEGLI
ncbi:MAG: hypothetical protein K2H37_05085 [Lachnospiraceae bacterium]|nr:hypothetical protein [Lachnospiraceae bacterium]